MDLAWDDVRLFLALARARTMGQAATALGLNISTVSRRLTALEATLDTVLFDRGRDGLRATHAAEALLVAAEQAEAGVTQFAQAADGFERAVAGEVRVACPPDVADVLILPGLPRLFSAHPQLRISLAPGLAAVDLTRREADLALRTVRPTRGDLVVKKALSIQWAPAAAPQLAAQAGAVQALDDVPWIAWSEGRPNPPARWLDAQLQAAPRLRTDSMPTQIAAARAGLGAVLLPTVSARHHGLVPLDVAGLALPPLPTDALYLVTHQALRRVPRIHAVWTHLAEQLALTQT